MADKKNNIRKVVVSLTEEEFKAFDTYCKYHELTKQKALRDYISSLVREQDFILEEDSDENKSNTKVSAFKKKFKFGKKKKDKKK